VSTRGCRNGDCEASRTGHVTDSPHDRNVVGSRVGGAAGDGGGSGCVRDCGWTDRGAC